MLGLSYAAVPLYDLFCRVTGFGGTTQISDNAPKIVLNKVVSVAMLKDLINSLKYGLKTFVGENGVRLSGGQKQRLAIARALYKNHSLLILDEATSSVDSETEKNILKNIVNNNPKITVLMIAHRLQTLKNCDYILEIKNKRLFKYQNINQYKAKNIINEK